MHEGAYFRNFMVFHKTKRDCTFCMLYSRSTTKTYMDEFGLGCVLNMCQEILD